MMSTMERNNMSPARMQSPQQLKQAPAGFLQTSAKSLSTGNMTPAPAGRSSATPKVIGVSTPANMDTSILSNASSTFANTSWMLNLSPGVQPLYRGDFGQSPAPTQPFAMPGQMPAAQTVTCKDHPNATCNCMASWGVDPSLPKKPPFSFPCLIGLALRSIPSSRMSVSQIYDYITKRFPYFRTAKAGWKNSVRHNLSLNKMFCKLERREDEQGKGAMWGISENMRDQLNRDILQTEQRYPQKIAEAMKEPDPSATVEQHRMAVGLGQQIGRAASSAPTLLQMSPAMQHHHGMAQAGFMHQYQPYHFPVDHQQVQQVQQMQLAHMGQQQNGITMLTSDGSSSGPLRLDEMPQMYDSRPVTINDLMSTPATDFFNPDQQQTSASSINASQMMADFPPSLYELTSQSSYDDISRTQLSNMQIPRCSPTKLGLYSPTKLEHLGDSPSKLGSLGGANYSPSKVLGGSSSGGYGMDDIEQIKMDFGISEVDDAAAMVL